MLRYVNGPVVSLSTLPIGVSGASTRSSKDAEATASTVIVVSTDTPVELGGGLAEILISPTLKKPLAGVEYADCAKKITKKTAKNDIAKTARRRIPT